MVSLTNEHFITSNAVTPLPCCFSCLSLHIQVYESRRVMLIAIRHRKQLVLLIFEELLGQFCLDYLKQQLTVNKCCSFNSRLLLSPTPNDHSNQGGNTPNTRGL
ncbi:hypothetical protein FKM82_022376 [Ascaphus truei]